MLLCLYRDYITKKRCEDKATYGSYCWIHYHESPTTSRFKSSTSLAQLTLQLNAIQLDHHSALVSLSKVSRNDSGIVQSAIQAKFEPDRQSSDVTLIEIENKSERDLVIAQQNTIGKKLLFQSSIPIANKETIILVFN